MNCESSNFVGTYNIVGIPQGSDVDIPINYKTGDPLTTLDLSGYTAKLQARRNYNQPVLLELSTSDSSIILNSTSPNITLKFLKSKTLNMTQFDDMIYDLEIISSTGLVTRALEGTFSISQEVTR